MVSDLWSVGSVAKWAGGNHLPNEQGGPSRAAGEGTSSNAICVPSATAERGSPGKLPESPPMYPDYESVMTLYNTCYSILMAGLLVMAPDEAPERRMSRESPQIISVPSVSSSRTSPIPELPDP